MHTRESQKLVGASPCRCESCPADHFPFARDNSGKVYLFPGSEIRVTSLTTRVVVGSSPTLPIILRGGSSMGRARYRLWSVFSWISFLGSEGEATSLQSEPRAWREPWLQIRAPTVYVSKRWEGLQGDFACVSPRIYFGGSENAVTPVRAAPFRWSRSLVRYQPVPSREP
jgi:hypothetical protein